MAVVDLREAHSKRPKEKPHKTGMQRLEELERRVDILTKSLAALNGCDIAEIELINDK